MKVGIIQSNFLPWRGYFDFIREVDLFIIYDEVQYTKGDWRNRNKIKTPNGMKWITVPVIQGHLKKIIRETSIDYSRPWARNMLNQIQESYRKSPYFGPYFAELNELLLEPSASISDLNLHLIKWVCTHLEINTPISLSHHYQQQGEKTERLINILQQVGATTYLSGPAGKAYLNPKLFEKAGVCLEYKVYDYPVYEQLYPPFEPMLSIIDLLFMTGKNANLYLS